MSAILIITFRLLYLQLIVISLKKINCKEQRIPVFILGGLRVRFSSNFIDIN